MKLITQLEINVGIDGKDFVVIASADTVLVKENGQRIIDQSREHIDPSDAMKEKIRAVLEEAYASECCDICVDDAISYMDHTRKASMARVDQNAAAMAEAEERMAAIDRVHAVKTQAMEDAALADVAAAVEMARIEKVKADLLKVQALELEEKTRRDVQEAADLQLARIEEAKAKALADLAAIREEHAAMMALANPLLPEAEEEIAEELAEPEPVAEEAPVVEEVAPVDDFITPALDDEPLADVVSEEADNA